MFIACTWLYCCCGCSVCTLLLSVEVVQNQYCTVLLSVSYCWLFTLAAPCCGADRCSGLLEVAMLQSTQ